MRGSVVLLAVMALTLLGGCENSLKEQNAHLMEENEGLRAQLGERNTALETAQGELHDRDVRIAELEQQVQDPPAGMAAGRDPFAGIEGVTGSVGAGEVTASVASDVLFDPGKSSLKSTAKRSLDEVARVLKQQYMGRPIRVAGHTDTDPIRKSGFKSNYHLGFERAFAVREYLISRGVASHLVYVASHGPDQAMSTKSQSRRVEIAVVLTE
jgi:outer membrane protein OmpA-like peptidoglycan-associated protein